PQDARRMPAGCQPGQVPAGCMSCRYLYLGCQVFTITRHHNPLYTDSYIYRNTHTNTHTHTHTHEETQETQRKDCISVNRSEEHTSELQSHLNLVCRPLLEKKQNR